MKIVRRLLLAIVAVVLAVLILPPLYFAVFPVEHPSLPEPGRRVELPGGAAVNVVERGDGPPVVLVHGLPGNAYEWQPTIDALAARGRRAIAYDRVGFGHSDPRPAGSPFTVEQNATELLALLEALDLRDATVAGWSYGGATAMAAARRDPSRFGRLVLVGSAGPGVERPQPPLLVRALMSDPGLLWLRAVPPAASGLRAAVVDVAFSGQPRPDWYQPLVEANLARPATGLAYVSEMRRFDPASAPDTTGITVPTVIVHGEDDHLAPIGIGRELARLSPAARLVVVEGGSHMLPVTHADRLSDEIVGAGS